MNSVRPSAPIPGAKPSALRSMSPLRRPSLQLKPPLRRLPPLLHNHPPNQIRSPLRNPRLHRRRNQLLNQRHLRSPITVTRTSLRPCGPNFSPAHQNAVSVSSGGSSDPCSFPKTLPSLTHLKSAPAKYPIGATLTAFRINTSKSVSKQRALTGIIPFTQRRCIMPGNATGNQLHRACSLALGCYGDWLNAALWFWGGRDVWR